MANTKTEIEWTDRTWNPTTGCSKISAGCANCYAETIAHRFKKAFPFGFNFVVHPERLSEPRKWRKPSRIFVNSMSDLFHDEMPLSFLKEIFEVMNQTPRHTYQVLTKRPDNALQLADCVTWTDNIWMGVTIEHQKYSDRINLLRQIPARIRFLSCEPLLGPLELNLKNIDWVIVGGESGKGHRPIDLRWVENIRQQCESAEVAFFFKQWGGITPKANGRLLNGRTYDEMPA